MDIIKSKNIIKLLNESQIHGVGLKVIGEQVWENKNEGDELSCVVIASLSGTNGKAVIPVLSPAEIEALDAAEPPRELLRIDVVNRELLHSDTMGDSETEENVESHPEAVSSDQDIRIAPTASNVLKKLQEEKSELLEKRDQLRAQLDQLLDSSAAVPPLAPSTSSHAKHHSYKTRKEEEDKDILVLLLFNLYMFFIIVLVLFLREGKEEKDEENEKNRPEIIWKDKYVLE
ncbi:hypothetical protein IRJ41_014182 [Triplophysa rosa]|uniref:Uncharacterized protein n=1 Tax=Triplophysa rosa TaxID=992332 RepID=A0A9W7T3J1_TRIRA|nr:hypothetical protein IRJ41_014182 [Triplophysa rosa]